MLHNIGTKPIKYDTKTLYHHKCIYNYNGHSKRYYSNSSNSNTELDEFDLCVIGCGGGGFAGTIRAWDYGKKIAVINSLSNLSRTTIHNGACLT